MASLYLHIPYCVRKCIYCDFHVEPLGTGPLPHRLQAMETQDHSRFIRAIELELQRLPSGFAPETIYIGGGTPTELSETDFVRLFETLQRSVDTRHVGEWVCEANPGTLSRRKASYMLESGVNRVSLGVQSFHDQALEYLSRIHNGREALDGAHMLRSEGARNMSVDLIFGTPGTGLDHIQHDLDHLAQLQPEHVSWYLLDYVEGTALTHMRDQGHIQEMDEDLICDQYTRIREGLTALGYHQYEIFNFCKPGWESRHNGIYWVGGEYVGIGPSAHSHMEGERWHNLKSTALYMHALEEGKDIRQEVERLCAEAKARELLMTSMRRTAGTSRSWFLEQTGFDPVALGGDALVQQCELGAILLEEDRLRLHPDVYLIANRVLAELL